MPAGVATGRFFYGDFELWLEAIEPDEQDARGVLQEFAGIDRPKKMRIPASENMSNDLRVRCVGPPNPGAKNQAGWIARKRATRLALWARARYSYPVCWILDATAKNTLAALGPPLQTTANPHGLIVGDVVLGRPAAGGVQTHYLASVATVPNPNELTISVIEQADLTVTPAIGDELYLVEAYWLSMIYESTRTVKAPNGMPYAKEMIYSFKDGGGSDYARTAAP